MMRIYEIAAKNFILRNNQQVNWNGTGSDNGNGEFWDTTMPSQESFELGDNECGTETHSDSDLVMGNSNSNPCYSHERNEIC